MKIGVFSKSINDPKHRDALLVLVRILQKRGHEIWTTPSLEDFIRMNHDDISPLVFDEVEGIGKPIDFLFSIGGDGTVLESLKIVKSSEVPILSINTGRLGFLTGVGLSELEDAIERIELGQYILESRSLLHLESSEKVFNFNFALNDFVVHKKETSSMIVVHTYLNGEFLNSYWSDGLILSTPTGSTGYSLSCGGPILFPKSDSFVLTPIAPHNLNVRPVVIPDDAVISFEIEGRANSYLTSLDSRSQSITKDVTMAVRRADFVLKLLRLNDTNFMDNLRSKLSWGYDRRSEN
jgi:NAD+ kinase